MNRRLLIGILGGGVVGFLVGWLARPHSSSGTAEAAGARAAQLEAALQSKSSQLERLTKPGVKPPATVKSETTGTTHAADPAESAVREEHESRMAAMKKQFLDKQKLRIDERLAALRSRLRLSDEQVAAIREIMEKNPEGPQAMMMQAMAGGDVDEEGLLLDFLRPGQKSAEMTGKITALLAPEQQEAYATFRQEQRTNDIEIKTGKELARLQSSLTLSPEQKDKAFAVLSAMAEQEYDTPVSPMAGFMAQQIEAQPDSAETKELQGHVAEIKAAGDLVTQRRQQRVEAMREILSPEQLSLYEDQQKRSTMADMMEGLGDMPGDLLMGLGVQ